MAAIWERIMDIKSGHAFQRYIKGVFKQAATEAFLKAIGEDDGVG